MIVYAWSSPGCPWPATPTCWSWIGSSGRGATDLTRETVTTAEGLPAVLFEGLSGQEAFTWLAQGAVSEGVGVEIVYWFPIDQFETVRELAYGSFDTLLVY